MRILVIHHGDADGRCAAAIARMARPDAEMDFIEMNYGDALPPLKGVDRDYEYIFILDFSLEPDEMSKIVDDLHYTVLWIDHHITAIEKLATFRDLGGIRRDGTAACMLTWEWFYPPDQTYPFPNPEVPWVVKYIADRDVWKLEYGDDTRHFYEMFCTYNPAPDNVGDWDYLFDLKDVSLSKFVRQGELLRTVRIKKLQYRINSFAYKTTIDGHEAIKINVQGSGDLGELINKMGAPIAWCYIEKMQADKFVRINSLYSKTVDVSEIATARGGGGGGHRGAAGFVEAIAWDHHCIPLKGGRT